jgi:hypothetical protein
LPGIIRFPSPSGQLFTDLFSVWVSDLFVNPERLFGKSDGAHVVAKLVKRQSHTPKRIGFASPVANLAGDSQVLLMKLDGFVWLTQMS